MSSTNKTENYELSQFVGTDIPSILNDYNGDMRKIDSAIKAVANAEGSSAVNIASLQATVGQHSTEISELNSGVNNLTGRVVADEEAVNDITARVDVIEDNMSTTAITIARDTYTSFRLGLNHLYSLISALSVKQLMGSKLKIGQLVFHVCNIDNSTIRFECSNYQYLADRLGMLCHSCSLSNNSEYMSALLNIESAGSYRQTDHREEAQSEIVFTYQKEV